MALGDPYISVDELKQYAQIADSVDDAVLEPITRGVSSGINAFCHRQFNDAASVSPRVCDVYDPWYLRVDDFSTITGLVVKTDTGNNGGYATTIANSTLTLYPLNGVRDGQPGFPFNGLVMSRTQPQWPTWMPNPAGPLVQVTARWGWAAVPPEVKQASLIKATRVFGRRSSPHGIVGQGDFVFRVSSHEDPDVVDMLTPLKTDFAVIV